MRIAEIYRSIQGEGFLTGTDSIFVRTSGCNLRCWFCDTPHASWEPTGEDMSVHDIVRAVDRWNVTHVVLTGGEPMLWSETLPLTRQLQDRGHHITIETAGTLYLPVHCDLMSISPKMSNSVPQRSQHPRWRQRHERTRTAAEVIRRLVDQYAYQFKFVVDEPGDLEEVDQYLEQFPEIDGDSVMLMPQGTSQEALEEAQAWLEPLCQERGQRFCPRKQVEWFGLVRGT